MKTNAWLKIAAIVALAVFFMVGCGSSEEPKTEEPAATAETTEAATEAPAEAVAEPVAEEVVITVASDCTWPPMEFLDADKKIVGFAPDLLAAMAEASDIKFEINNTAWDGIFAGLAAGQYDMIASSVSITPERQATMDFSDPYFEVKQGVLVNKDSGIASVADLAGKKIGAQIGTTGYFAAQAIEGADAASYDEVGLAVEDLYNGNIDAAICDDSVAYDYALQNEKYKDKLDLVFVIASDTPEYLGFAFQKGSADKIELVNAALAKVKESGKYDEIMDKWF